MFASSVSMDGKRDDQAVRHTGAERLTFQRLEANVVDTLEYMNNALIDTKLSVVTACCGSSYISLR